MIFHFPALVIDPPLERLQEVTKHTGNHWLPVIGNPCEFSSVFCNLSKLKGYKKQIPLAKSGAMEILASFLSVRKLEVGLLQMISYEVAEISHPDSEAFAHFLNRFPVFNGVNSNRF